MLQAQSSPRFEPAAGGGPPRGKVTPPLEAALEELRAALSQGQVEPVCTAYLRLHRIAHAMSMPLRDFFARLACCCGQEAVSQIVSAFSHRDCFMCDDGTAPCDACEKKGQVDRFRCPRCEGTTMEICTFCQGAGWCSLEDVPLELRQAVELQRRRHLEQGMQKLAALAAQAGPGDSAALPPEKRRELTAWLTRLQARASAYVHDHPAADDGQVARLGASVAQVDRLLKVLWPGPREGEAK